MQLVVEVRSTEAGLRGEVRLPGREAVPFAGWLEFLALIEAAAGPNTAEGEALRPVTAEPPAEPGRSSLLRQARPSDESGKGDQ